MIRKPWPIIIVSFIFFMIPIFNILGTYLILGENLLFSAYIHELFLNSKNIFLLLTFIVPSFISGIAIYSVKKWSYPVFLLCMFWITCYVISNYSLEVSRWELFLTVLLPMFINIGYVSYLLLPNLRAPYYNSRLRWWETKPRYIYATRLNIKGGDLQTEGVMENISEGGLFASIVSPLKAQSNVVLNFTVLDLNLELQARIVYCKNDGRSYGLQFYDVSKAQNKILKEIAKSLADKKYPEVRPVPNWLIDLKKWFLILLKTGKGLLPEIPDTNSKENK